MAALEITVDSGVAMHAEPQLAAAGASATSAVFVGQRIERLKDAALLSGRGAYAVDVGVKPSTTISTARVIRCCRDHDCEQHLTVESPAD